MNDLTKEEFLLLTRLSVFGKDDISISVFIEAVSFSNAEHKNLYLDKIFEFKKKKTFRNNSKSM